MAGRSSDDADRRQPRRDAGAPQVARQGTGRAHRHHGGERLAAEERRAKGVRVETLAGTGAVLGCQPGGRLEFPPGDESTGCEP